jgi:hypothetical protein
MKLTRFEILKPTTTLLFTVLSCGVILAEQGPLQLFNAERAPDAQMLTLQDLQLYSLEQSDEHSVLKGPVSTDPYQEHYWQFSWTKSTETIGSSGILEVTFLDKGAGVHEAALLVDARFHGSWMGPDRQVSYTRLNTGTMRSSYYAFDFGRAEGMAAAPVLRFKGLQYLKSIEFHRKFSDTEWEQARAAVPVDVEPMVQLKRPMQLVVSAGVTVRGDWNDLQSSLDNLHELAPLAKVLGFNAIESYVRWDLVEPQKGRFDFRFYDSIVRKISSYGLKWFPLLIVGSAYSLPDWFIDSDESVGFVCLEHNLANPIQSIWSPYHPKYVTRFLKAFGEHYEPMGVLQGVRLGPTGNYGESQYPAGGNWGHQGQAMHIHIGFWAGDDYAQEDFRNYLKERYKNIDSLNQAWESEFRSFQEVRTFLPNLSYWKRRRLDMARWYTQSMSDWCAWWAVEARKAMPKTVIYQSAGGWGFLEAGTDYVDQARAMVDIQGGIRLTNETDSFHQNFFATRLATTAGRLYGIDIGFEPASSHTARGTVGRLFNTIVTNGDHLFTYHSNLLTRPTAIQKWLEYSHFLDTRQDPVIDVAVYYPETMNQLDDSTFRHLYAWGFNPRAREIRTHIEVDYLNETLIREGYLDRYTALVFCWGRIIDEDVQRIIDAWIRKGGVALYPSFPRGDQETIEGARSVFQGWMRGDTGKGRFLRFPGDMEPPDLYGEFVNEKLQEIPGIHQWTQQVISIDHPKRVFFSVQEDGHLLAINYDQSSADIRLPDGRQFTLQPYSIERLLLK